MDERDDKIRQIAADLGIDWDEFTAVDSVWAAIEHERAAEAARMTAYVDVMMPRITADLTRNFLRPALAAAGVDDVDRYEVSWVREGGFRPGLFAQEGDRACAPGNLTPCPPWPDFVYDEQRKWPAEMYTAGEFDEGADQ